MDTEDEGSRNPFSRFDPIYQRANQYSFGLLEILRISISRFYEKQGIEGAASIAFFAIFALPPMLIVTVSVGSYFLESIDVQELVLNLVEATFPIPTDVVVDLIDQILQQRTSLGIIGLISLAWSAGGVLMTLSTNVNRAWTEAKPRNYLQNRLVAFVIIGVLSAALVAISILATLLGVIAQLEPLLLPVPVPDNFLTGVILFALRTALFLALYLWIPTIRVRFSPALIAAITASLGWELTTTGFGIYLNWGLDYYNLIYGSLGTLVAAMFWIYLNSVIIVYGAHLCAAIAYHQTGRKLSNESAWINES